MFFPELIASIKTKYKVLEIGPGATPYARSDAFLELDFSNDDEKLKQRGDVIDEANFGGRPVYYYDGNRFPFEDNQFDYVICSHVIEHVSDPAIFLSEVFRVGSGRGYLEYPLSTYEYLYDFDVHLHFVKFDFDKRVLRFLPKKDTNFSEFSSLTAIFFKSLQYGWDDLCAANKKFFFEGFEYSQPFAVEKEVGFERLRPAESLLAPKSPIRRFAGRVLNKLNL